MKKKQKEDGRRTKKRKRKGKDMEVVEYKEKGKEDD